MTVNQRVSGSSPEGGATENQRVTLNCNPFVFYHSVTFPSQTPIKTIISGNKKGLVSMSNPDGFRL